MARPRSARTLTAVASVIAAGIATVLVSLPAQAADPVDGAQTSGDVLFPNVGNGGYDVRHYDVGMVWTPATVPGGTNDQSIVATTTVKAVTTGAPLKSFSLDFEGLSVDSVTVNGQAAPWTRDIDVAATKYKLIITPVTPVEGAFTTVIAYRGTPSSHTDADGSKEGWNATNDGATFLNQPIGSMTGFPNNNTPADKATYTFSLNVPTTILGSPAAAVSNGELTSKTVNADRTTWVWTQTKPMASELSLISIGQYTPFESDITLASGRVLHEWSFVDPKATGAASAQTARGQLKGIIDFFESRYGPYPGNSTGIVVDSLAPNSGINYALETQDRSFFPNSVGASTNVHEVMHQWFGNNVSPRVWNDLWLNEGAATFAEEQYPDDATEDAFFGLWNTTASNSANWSTPPAAMTDPADLYGWHVYNRGAMTLEALKTAIGVGDFARVMRQWQVRYAGTSRDTAAFIDLAEEVDGRDLTAFFKDWIYDPDKPAWPGRFDLGLVSSPASGDVAPASTVTYTISAKNTGRVPLDGAVVTVDVSDVLDDGSISAATLPAGLSLSGRTLTWNVPSTALSTTASTTFRAVVERGNTIGQLVATARASTLGSTCTVCRSALNIKLGKLSKTPAPKIAGKALVGKRLSARPGTWDAGVKLRYQWYVGKRAVARATDKHFKVRGKHVGKRLQVRVTGTKPGFMPETTRSKRTPRVR